MAILQIKAFEAGPSASGVSMSQGVARGGTYFRVSVTADAQQGLFGRLLVLGKDAIALIVTDDPKLLHLMGVRVVGSSDSAGILAAGGPRGSVWIKVQPWRPAEGKRPAASLPIINAKVEGGGISVKLPEWARPVRDHTKAAR